MTPFIKKRSRDNPLREVSAIIHFLNSIWHYHITWCQTCKIRPKENILKKLHLLCLPESLTEHWLQCSTFSHSGPLCPCCHLQNTWQLGMSTPGWPEAKPAIAAQPRCEQGDEELRLVPSPSVGSRAHPI